MSNESKKFTKEQKAAIALKAASGGADETQRLAEEHGISENKIKEWIRETGATVVEDEHEEYSLEATENFSKQVEYGVTFDKLNYGRLAFWSVFGTAVILIMIIAIMALYDYTSTSTTQQASERSLYYNIEQLRDTDRTKLESFGVVDPDEGIYHIPIDSAISIMAREFE